MTGSCGEDPLFSAGSRRRPSAAASALPHEPPDPVKRVLIGPNRKAQSV